MCYVYKTYLRKKGKLEKANERGALEFSQGGGAFSLDWNFSDCVSYIQCRRVKSWC